MKTTRTTGTLAALIVGASTLAPNATAATPKGGSFLLTSQEMAAARSHISNFSGVIGSCDKALTTTPHPVATLNLGAHYDANGTTDSQKNNTLEGDADNVYHLGLCYQLTGKTSYATAAQKIIDAWTTTLKSAPSEQGKAVITFAMPSMIGGATWVRGVNGWDGKAFTNFLGKVVVPNDQLSAKNNHGLWAVLTLASAATFANDSKAMDLAVARWQQIVAGEVRPDGTMPLEMDRSDTSDFHGGPTKGIRGLAYTNYAMLPMSMSAKLFADAGKPVWNTTGGTLMAKAYAKAAQWTLNPTTFPYYASNHGKLQDTQSASYLPLMLRHYPNADAVAAVKKGYTKGNTFLLPELFPLVSATTPTPAASPCGTPAASSKPSSTPRPIASPSHAGPMVQTDHVGSGANNTMAFTASMFTVAGAVIALGAIKRQRAAARK